MNSELDSTNANKTSCGKLECNGNSSSWFTLQLWWPSAHNATAAVLLCDILGEEKGFYKSQAKSTILNFLFMCIKLYKALISTTQLESL